MPLDTTVLGAKLETTVGTFAAPSLSTDALVTFNYQITPIQSEEVRRAVDLGFPGRRPSTKTGVHARHAFSVELSGSGTATTAPFWAKLLRGALFGAAVPGASSVSIPLASTGDGASLSLSGYKDSERFQARMVRGNAVLSFVEKQLPRIDFDFLGLIEGSPTAAAAPGAVTLPTYPNPVEVNLANTVIIVDGFTLGCREFTLDLGMKTELYSTTGSRAIIFGKDETGDRRAPSGRILAELPGAAAKDYFGPTLSGTPLSFSLVHGTAAGNIIELASSNLVFEDIQLTVESNRVFMSATVGFVATAANNDFTLITK
ncbi:phage tail tube protein [Polymorphobacter sp.]|uniref:phage tail tube protein n=1 Tax=Polymorphobacter sp. TaxID=1909290 RepID=UPI003F7011E6